MTVATRSLVVVLVPFVFVFVAFVGCGGSTLSPHPDAGGDAGADSSPSPSIDERADAPADGAADVAGDAAGDTPLDDDAGGGGDGPADPDAGVCSSPSDEAAPLQMLTAADYRRVVRDLGGVVALSTAFPSQPTESGFESRAVLQVATPLLAVAWQGAAEEVAAAMVGRLTQTLGCDPAAIGESACVAQFVRSFGRLAYRRPLTADESNRLMALYDAFRPQVTLARAVGVVIRAVLQSPHFLYRVELPQAPALGGRVSLSSYEVATRLSFLAWRTGPDEALLAAAEASLLSTPEERETQMRRLLADPHAREAVREFFRQWLDIDRVGSVSKNPTLFPQFTPALGAAMREEAYRLIDHVTFDGDGKLGTLLAGQETILNAELAQLYGLTPPASGSWQLVSLASTPRRGLLTQGWFLAAQASATETLPVARGIFVRARLLCQQVPPLPLNFESTPPPPDATRTTRERWTAALTGPTCGACHSLLDDPGFAFEHYDAIGAYRTVENGKAIDSAGTLQAAPGTGEPLTFVDAPDLLTQLAAGPLVRDCVVRRWYENTVGRRAEAEDQCRLADLAAAAAASGGDLRELLVALARRDELTPRPAGVILPPPDPAYVPPGGSSDERAIRKGVLDLAIAEIANLQRRFPDSSDRMRLDVHLGVLRELQAAAASASQ